MDFPLVNLIFPLVRTVFLFAALFCVVRFVFGARVPNWAYPAAASLLILHGALSLIQTNGPRFTLSGESGVVPSFGGEVRSLAPDGLTDAERLQMNRDIYNQNKVGE